MVHWFENEHIHLRILILVLGVIKSFHSHHSTQYVAYFISGFYAGVQCGSGETLNTTNTADANSTQTFAKCND